MFERPPLSPVPPCAQAPELLLASASPRRARILAALGVRLRVMPADAAECALADPAATVAANARTKLLAALSAHPGRWILTADTVVEADGRVLGKPKDKADALRMLLSFSEGTQRVFTAFCLVSPDTPEPVRRIAVSTVHFRRIDRALAAGYLEQARTLDRAGAYDIDTFGERIISRCEGSYTNIMGLPAPDVAAALRSLGYPLPAAPLPL